MSFQADADAWRCSILDRGLASDLLGPAAGGMT